MQKYTSYFGKGIKTGYRNGHCSLETLIKMANKSENKQIHVTLGLRDTSGKRRHGRDEYIVYADGSYDVKRLDSWNGGGQYLK